MHSSCLFSTDSVVYSTKMHSGPTEFQDGNFLTSIRR